MSYIKADEFSLPSDKGTHVRMKRVLSYGDWSACLSFYRSYELPKPDPEDEAELTKLKLALAETERNVAMARVALTRLLIDWDLTDVDDAPIPITTEGLEMLENVDLDFLYEKAHALLKGRPVEAEGPFGNSSGKRSRATRSSRRKS